MTIEPGSVPDDENLLNGPESPEDEPTEEMEPVRELHEEDDDFLDADQEEPSDL